VVVPKITAGQADEMVGRGWFVGYTPEVDLHEGLVTVDEFDADARADALRSSEYAVFGGGLAVRGTMNLDADPCRSIYVVQEVLHARRLILGDAVLDVQGVVEVDEWLFGSQTEGLFEVMGRSIDSPGDADVMLEHVRAPLLVLYDRNRGTFVLRERGEPRDVTDLLPDLLDDDEWSSVGVFDTVAELRVNDKLLRERLCDGAPVFR